MVLNLADCCVILIFGPSGCGLLLPEFYEIVQILFTYSLDSIDTMYEDSRSLSILDKERSERIVQDPIEFRLKQSNPAPGPFFSITRKYMEVQHVRSRGRIQRLQ